LRPGIPVKTNTPFGPSHGSASNASGAAPAASTMRSMGPIRSASSSGVSSRREAQPMPNAWTSSDFFPRGSRE
jgi:hypothetical protein